MRITILLDLLCSNGIVDDASESTKETHEIWCFSSAMAFYFLKKIHIPTHPQINDEKTYSLQNLGRAAHYCTNVYTIYFPSLISISSLWAVITVIGEYFGESTFPAHE